MASLFPASVDTFSTPTAGSATSSPSHATLHVNVNNAITNAQTYMGMTLISSTTVGSAVSSVTVSSAFSSTYDNYQIHLNGIKFNTTNGTMKCALGSTTTGYYQNGYYTNYASATINGNPANNTNPYFEVAFTEATNTNAQSVMFHLYAPNLADHTRMSSAWATESYTGVFNGILNNTTQYTAFTISTSGGTPTMTGGTIRVYGYRQ